MARKLTPFQKVDGIGAVSCSQNGSLRCSAITLRNGGVCLYSPVSGLNAAVKESLDSMGEVQYLLAPNHYHNKGLNEYAEAFPNASLCTTEAAAPRLSKVTGGTFETLENLASDLPDGVDLLYPEGLKTGEVWIRHRTSALTTWLVADSFRGSETDGSPELLKTFPGFGVEDKAIYRDWVARQIDEDQPEIVIPCHGTIIRSAMLPASLLKLMDSSF